MSRRPNAAEIGRFFVENIEPRFMPEPNSGCWLWIGVVNEKGYARIYRNRRHPYVHRLVYEMTYGSVPGGLVLDHKCRVRCCVNPAHLEPVTSLENTRRGEVNKARKEQTHCKRGHAFTVENTHFSRRGPTWTSRVCRACVRLRAKLRAAA